jgi:hypothetical protein
MREAPPAIDLATARRAVAFGLTISLVACSHSSAPSSGASSAAPAAANRTLTPTKSTYDVALKPDTKIIDGDTMSRAYRGPGTDGTLKFDAASAPAVAALKPGAVAIFAGTAILKVTSVNSAGGTLSVAGTPAGLEDAIDHGHIAWSAPLDFKKMAFNPPPGFHRVAADSGPLLALKNFLGTPAQAGISLSDNTWKGKVKDWDVTIALTPSNGNLHIDVDANKSIGGGTIDVHGVAQLNGLTNSTSITLVNGATTELTFDNDGIKGTVDFNWKVAFDADHGGSDPKMKEPDVENLPFSLDFPIPAGPIPFVVKFKSGFAFEPFFSSKVAVAQGSYHASFGGDMPMTDSAAADSAGAATGAAAAATPPAGDSATLSGDGSINSYGGTMSLAAIGLSTTVAIPKISLSIGLPSALNSFLQSPDFGGPYATFMTQANFLATGTLTMVQCEKRELKIMAFVGYKPGLLGKLKLQPKSKTVFEKTFTEIRPPNITLCNH